MVTSGRLIRHEPVRYVSGCFLRRHWDLICRRWRPDLSDSFDGTTLEGVTGGVLGRKWLFKQENESLWTVRLQFHADARIISDR